MSYLTPRQNLIAALEGAKPAYIPFTINEEFLTTDPAWSKLFEKGLCVIPYRSTVREVTTNVEQVVTNQQLQGRETKRLTLRTPAGEISQVEINGWRVEYFLKAPADYRVMEHIIRNTRIESASEEFSKTEEKIGDQGITLIGAGRSPMQTILVDYAGLEAFSLQLSDGFSELFSLADILKSQLIQRCQLIAEGPGRYVSLLENLTAEVWGPERFAKYHIPIYKQIFEILHAGGKKIYAHFDGKLACLANLIARTELDGLESLTPPPEGDMTYAEARGIFPGKVFWANLNVAHYALSPDQLRCRLLELVYQAGPDGGLLAFEISEDLPANWKEAIPVVLDTLCDMKW